MPYLNQINEIENTINILSQAPILWIDTEVADYQSQNPRLSLIQVSADPHDTTGEHTYILDVLDQEDLINTFIDHIMNNPRIEKIFHNASYDLQFLGKERALTVTCTLKMAQAIPYYILPVKNYKLKTLTEELCQINQVDKQEQGSNWGQRPLTHQQLNYAKLDIVYLTQVYHHLIKIINNIYIDPQQENLAELDEKYAEIVEEWRELDEKLTELKTRIKATMLSQTIEKYHHFKLATFPTKTVKTNLNNLADLVFRYGTEIHFPIRITKDLQKQLGKLLKDPSLSIEETTTWRLITQEKKSKLPEKILPDPQTENLEELSQEYDKVFFKWRFFDSEMEEIKRRIKEAMIAQATKETPHFKLSSSALLKTDFWGLAKLIHGLEISLDYPLQLTQEIQEQLGDLITDLNPEITENMQTQLRSSISGES